MKILIVSVGKSHDKDIVGSIHDFTARISHYSSIEWKLIPNGRDAKEEADSLLRIIDEKDYVILLDERGKELSSPEVAKMLEWRLNESTQRLIFIIGGAYGVDEIIKARANFTWSLSRLVFPHQLVRLILVEQIYRAFTIQRGEKYHHQ